MGKHPEEEEALAGTAKEGGDGGKLIAGFCGGGSGFLVCRGDKSIIAKQTRVEQIVTGAEEGGFRGRWREEGWF